ncbi:transcriptional repressor [Thalassotalea euphylliae]|uniref:Transcriptional repressor n=1 Tax=Thalassotalea euphylliae TaxID=1655234 RepID=A0A3E0TTI9_9GAMM|nr:transcriptional repressor [Thalassotalea euphylliae]REL27734.1 transcriptional repressor [Thalassotalea euphylliae]
MNNWQTHIEQAEQSCRQSGERLTTKRKQVLAILLKADKAISAYELIELYSEQHQRTLAPMSAYRILDFLESVHLAHRLNTANKYVACAYIGCEHSHELPQFIVCQECQRVDELSACSSNLMALTDEIKQTGYQLSSPQIELTGVCQACLKLKQEQVTTTIEHRTQQQA